MLLSIWAGPDWEQHGRVMDIRRAIGMECIAFAGKDVSEMRVRHARGFHDHVRGMHQRVAGDAAAVAHAEAAACNIYGRRRARSVPSMDSGSSLADLGGRSRTPRGPARGQSAGPSTIVPAAAREVEEPAEFDVGSVIGVKNARWVDVADAPPDMTLLEREGLDAHGEGFISPYMATGGGRRVGRLWPCGLGRRRHAPRC